MKNILLGLVALSLVVIAYSSVSDKKYYRYTLMEYANQKDLTESLRTVEIQGRFNTMTECIKNEAIAFKVHNFDGNYYAKPDGTTTCKWQ